MFVLCKAHWVAIVYEMRYTNKAALPKEPLKSFNIEDSN